MGSVRGGGGGGGWGKMDGYGADRVRWMLLMG